MVRWEQRKNAYRATFYSTLLQLFFFRSFFNADKYYLHIWKLAKSASSWLQLIQELSGFTSHQFNSIQRMLFRFLWMPQWIVKAIILLQWNISWFRLQMSSHQNLYLSRWDSTRPTMTIYSSMDKESRHMGWSSFGLLNPCYGLSEANSSSNSLHRMSPHFSQVIWYHVRCISELYVDLFNDSFINIFIALSPSIFTANSTSVICTAMEQTRFLLCWYVPFCRIICLAPSAPWEVIKSQCCVLSLVMKKVDLWTRSGFEISHYFKI